MLVFTRCKRLDIGCRGFRGGFCEEGLGQPNARQFQSVPTDPLQHTAEPRSQTGGASGKK